MKRVLILTFSLILFQSCSKEIPVENSTIYFPPSGSDTWESVTPVSLGWNTSEIPALPESQLGIPGSVSPNGPHDMYSGIGKNGQYVSIIPSEKLVLIRMGEDPSSVPVPFLFLDDIWEQLNLIIK